MDLLSVTNAAHALAKGIPNVSKAMATKSSHSGSIKPTPSEDLDSAFFVLITGQIVGGDLYNADDLYCRYTLTYGNDWTILHGTESGLSQIARKGPTTFQGKVLQKCVFSYIFIIYIYIYIYLCVFVCLCGVIYERHF